MVYYLTGARPSRSAILNRITWTIGLANRPSANTLIRHALGRRARTSLACSSGNISGIQHCCPRTLATAGTCPRPRTLPLANLASQQTQVSSSAIVSTMRLTSIPHSDHSFRLISPSIFPRHAHYRARSAPSALSTSSTLFSGSNTCLLHNEGRGRVSSARLGSALEMPVHWFQTPLLQPSRSFTSASTPRYAQPYFAMKNSQGNTLRIHLAKSRDFVGIRSTRCQRKYNEDRYKVLVLNPPTLSPELASLEQANSSSSVGPPAASTAKNESNGNNSNGKSTEGTQMDADQKTLFYFSIFDGHGGSHTADYLTANLDEYIETAKPEMVPQVIRDLRKLGGYFRSFRPHFLEPFLPADFEERYGARNSATERAKNQQQQQRRVQIKGKGGQIKPMIFIPHPNATEEEQDQTLKSLQSGGGGKGDDKVVETHRDQQNHQKTKPVSETTAPANDSARAGTQNSRTDTEGGNRHGKDQSGGEDEDERYDEDEDPYVIARRRHLNKTSPLPGGTTSYFGTDRTEYEQLTMLQGNGSDAEDAARKKASQESEKVIPATMTLEQRLCLSFLKCDTDLIREKYRDGSTASVVIVQSKGAFWETQEDLDLILGHVGDTRVLLCEAPRGESIQLTTDHHPDAVVEADRIRKMAAYVTADSFGENMFLGQLANTRALGDIAMKPFGVSAEPEIVRRTVKAKEAAFLVLMSDGISSVMSNQEVVDCVKLEDNPTQAAANLLNLAEQLGAEDNCTVMVVRLPAWGAEMPDLSKELREYRWQSEAQQSRARRR